MADTPTDTKPPAMDPETGVAMDGAHPHNHRLRAESLARAGETSDRDGLISDELIADAGDRIERAKAAAEKAEADAKRRSTELRKMTTEQLEETAADELVDLSSAKNNGDRVDLIEAKRNPAPTISTDTPAAPPPVSDEGRAGENSEGAES